MKTTQSFCAVMASAALCGVAAADHHTMQCWNFENNPPTDPSQVDNPFGTPTLNTDGTFLPTAGGGTSGFGPRNGVYALTDGHSLLFTIPNMAAENSLKTVHLSMEFVIMGGQGEPPALYTKVDDLAGAGFDVHDPVVTVSMPNDPDDHWLLWDQDFTRMPCPDAEVVVIHGPSSPWTLYISNVCITTDCVEVPAPGALGLLGAAGVLARRRRMR